MREMLTGEQLASAFIHQNLYKEALKLLLDLQDITADCRLTIVILDLLVNRESSSTHVFQRVTEHLGHFDALQLSKINVVHSCSKGARDNIILDEVWKYLNLDQQFLLTNYLCLEKPCT